MTCLRKPNRVERKSPKKARQRGTRTTYPGTAFSRLHKHRNEAPWWAKGGA